MSHLSGPLMNSVLKFFKDSSQDEVTHTQYAINCMWAIASNSLVLFGTSLAKAYTGSVLNKPSFSSAISLIHHLANSKWRNLNTIVPTT